MRGAAAQQYCAMIGLGFVTLGPFHCAYIYLCVFYTAYAVLVCCEHGGVDLMGLKPSP